MWTTYFIKIIFEICTHEPGEKESVKENCRMGIPNTTHPLYPPKQERQYVDIL